MVFLEFLCGGNARDTSRRMPRKWAFENREVRMPRSGEGRTDAKEFVAVSK
jgi:hypothetical protein